jgi:hypothetical protein
MATIEPFENTVIKTVVRFSLEINKMVFNKSAKFRVFLYDINNMLISTSYITIEGEDYLNWSNDDNYVIQFVANKLGFVIVSVGNSQITESIDVSQITESVDGNVN